WGRGYAEGELISFSTCSCVLWQKEQRSGSSVLSFLNGVSPSAGQGRSREAILAVRIILGPFAASVHRRVCLLLTDWNALAVLGNNLVDQPVFLGLRRGHDEIALDVFFQTIERMPAVL